MFGDDGQDDILGGHNVPFGADGDDTIEGGNQEDVILGDNGLITRTLLSTRLGTWQTYLAPFDQVVIRDYQAFDDRDLIGGNDTIDGGAAMDILIGQRGNDGIRGGSGDDEIIGGLGADTVDGDAGVDHILGDAGQILRDFNADGTPQLNSNGVWHRDLLSEDIGRIIKVLPIDPITLFDPPADLAEKLLAADRIVLASGQLLSGDKANDASTGMWQTYAVLIDLVSADDDTIAGGDGDDVIMGQRGNDNLSGSGGNDLVIGDQGYNNVPFETDLPQMMNGIRVIGSDSAATSLLNWTLALPAFGQLLVSDFSAEPGDVTIPRARWDRVSQVNSVLSVAAMDDNLVTTDNLLLSPKVTFTPHAIGHTRDLQGSDVLNGDAGDDLLIGDDLVVDSEIATTLTAVQASMQQTFDALAAMMLAFDGLALDQSVVSQVVNHVVIPNRNLRYGNDTINGGSGEDMIVGDNGHYELPSTSTWPGSVTWKIKRSIY